MSTTYLELTHFVLVCLKKFRVICSVGRKEEILSCFPQNKNFIFKSSRQCQPDAKRCYKELDVQRTYTEKGRERKRPLVWRSQFFIWVVDKLGYRVNHNVPSTTEPRAKKGIISGKTQTLKPKPLALKLFSEGLLFPSLLGWILTHYWSREF